MTTPPHTPTWPSSFLREVRITPHSTPSYPPSQASTTASPHQNHMVVQLDPARSSSGPGTGVGMGVGTSSSATSTPQSRYGEFEAYASHDESTSPMLRPTSPSWVGTRSPSPPNTLPITSGPSSRPPSASHTTTRRSSISDPKWDAPNPASTLSPWILKRKSWIVLLPLALVSLTYAISSRRGGSYSASSHGAGRRISTWRPSFDRWRLNGEQGAAAQSGTSNADGDLGVEPQRLRHHWWKPQEILDDEGNLWPKQGKNGSKIRTEKGNVLMYRNDFGGTWDARTDSLRARCQADTPPLSTKWDYSKQTISGVNFGGWLTPEPFITPHLYEPYLAFEQEAVDEYTLSVHLGNKLEATLTHHYETFITEKDFAEVAGAGLNWVRIPLSYWAIETQEGEPFLAHVSWTYFLKAVEWARKYGLRINLDLHTVPGSSKLVSSTCKHGLWIYFADYVLLFKSLSGWNHSGKSGTVNLMNGVMGIANAERTLNIVRSLARFISLPVNRNIIPMFSVLNEPYLNVIGHAALRPLYVKLYDTVRAESGFGDGNGPVIVYHDGFKGTAVWHGFMKGSDRVALDSHRYLCFRTPNTDPLPVQSIKPCVNWMRHFNRTMRSFGISMVAEWSIATNDCGRFVNGVHVGTRFEGTYGDPKIVAAAEPGACEFWEDSTQWSKQMKLDLQDIALAHMDAFQNWFYWTWKTGPSLLHPDRPANPMWSYRHGLLNGYIPKNPRVFPGFCRRQFERFNRTQEKTYHFSGQLLNWQAGLGKNPGSEMDRGGYEWPPEKIGLGTFEGQQLFVKDLPRWSKTGKSSPLPWPKGLYRPRPKGTGEVDRAEEPWYEPIEGCVYPDAYSGVGEHVAIPDGTKCGASAF
ncbi:BZ3500_MvSof-1268-A1-R1_Chr8-2g10145 [Microbotryum saponariae]|uniref:glucan 1,3-beta-glucosidase n=1 Tax=Microbotryum saponariae TaxID=289078 RepID=A0A2X0MUV4_9BASI|nr:BZ3500_MvSof-1268-A1-R1_Chr8-2g10145 [Microbotryum saponariae]SDA01872.1 BZ3501_MvSof-1269-A2-R1_Chr8-2g09896 [Microbotryum saponariae]